MATRARPSPLPAAHVQALLRDGSLPGGLRGYLIMDFEATCERDDRSWPNEIVEFPAVLLDAGSLEAVDEFRAFVRPTERPRLTAFCTELTGIAQADVDGAEPLPTVLGRFGTWLAGHGLDAVAVLPVTCGNWDLQSMLPVECGRKGLDYPEALGRWCNIKDLFAQATQQSAGGMAGMLRMLGLRLEGRHHSGIDDSRNIARIFQTLLRRFGHARCSPAASVNTARGKGGKAVGKVQERGGPGSKLSKGSQGGAKGGGGYPIRTESSGDGADGHKVARQCTVSSAPVAVQADPLLAAGASSQAPHGKRSRWKRVDASASTSPQTASPTIAAAESRASEIAGRESPEHQPPSLAALDQSDTNLRPIPLEELQAPGLSQDLIQEFRREGVVVVPTLTPGQCTVVCGAINDASVALGKQHRTGYVTTYYLPEKEVLVTGHPAVYRATLSAYQAFDEFRTEGEPRTEFLTISKPERVSIKVSGEQDRELQKHVDVNYHKESVWHSPALRVQGMQVLQIGPYSHERPNGILTVVRRFHRYSRVASAALHPESGVLNMRQSRFSERDELHKFMPFTPTLPLAALSLYIRVVEALSASTEWPLAISGALEADLPKSGTVNGHVSVQSIWHHARTFIATGGPFSWSREPLGPRDLCWEPLESTISGCLVLWEGGLPHSNVLNKSGTERVCAYVDFAPNHRPNGMSTQVRVASLLEQSPGLGDGRGARSAAASRKGDGHGDNAEERRYAAGEGWAANAERRTAGSSRLWAHGGNYLHPRDDNLLLRALYGVDPRTRRPFTWEEYQEEYDRCTGG